MVQGTASRALLGVWMPLHRSGHGAGGCMIACAARICRQRRPQPAAVIGSQCAIGLELQLRTTLKAWSSSS